VLALVVRQYNTSLFRTWVLGFPLSSEKGNNINEINLEAEKVEALGRVVDGIHPPREDLVFVRHPVVIPDRKVDVRLPWREAGPPNHHDDKVDSDQ